MKFSEFGLKEELLEAISYMNFVEATPIQSQAIPVIMEGHDLIACAQTGTGKTAAFVLPVMNALMHSSAAGVRALILVPTRELAIQIDQQIEGISYGTGISSLSIYGGGDGSNWDDQKKALTEGVDIVIATPGKLISHLNMGYVNFDNLTHLMLDEADRMLDIGFYDDILKIISYLPLKRQSLLFSATMPQKIRDLVKKILKEPKEISISISKPAEGVLQAVYLTFDEQKSDLINHLIADKPEYESIIIFTSTKRSVSGIVSSLRKAKFEAEGISSSLDQPEREDVLRRFKAKKIRILVATDVISRGIDIKDINLVINYNVPDDAEAYVHRIGRTARASTTGVALTFVNESDMYLVQRIEKLIEKPIYKMQPPEHLGPGPVWKENSSKKRGPFKKRGFSKKKK